MKKIIIYGGSFDPIHNGHVQVAINAMKEIKADKLYFVPSYVSPDKKEYRANWSQRIDMIKIVLKKYDYFFLSKYESNIKGISYTWKTIKYFKNKFKNSQLFFLMGSDQYKNLKKWKKSEFILENCKIICHSRNDFINEKNLIFINKNFDITSSKSILEPKNNLDKDVIKYINDNSIYSIYRLKSEGLSNKRIDHSISVAKLAIELSKKYKNKNLIKKAYAAGIYHDISKEISEEKLIQYANEILNYKNYPNWKVIHAWMGEYVLRNKYLYNDKEILNAIKYHSIPRKNPTILEKIIFCADKLSYRENRKIDYELINLCKKNIDEGFKILIEKNMEWIK